MYIYIIYYDPEKYLKEQVKHQCEIVTGITSPPEVADTSDIKENVSIYEDTFSSIIPKPSQIPRKDVFYDSASDPFDENPSLSKLSSTKIAYGSVIPEIVLSPANTSENFLQKSQLSPKPETNKIQQDFLNVSGVKTPRKHTNSESLLRSVLTSQSNTKSPITNRKRALSAFSKDLRYIVISSSGIHNFNTAKDSFILHRKNFTGSSCFDEVKIKCDIESFWSQKCHTININQVPDDELCDLSVIGDTVVPISKPIVNPIRRLFNGINNTITKYFLEKLTLNTFTIIKSANELFWTNIKDVIPDCSDTNAPVAILNIGEQFNLIVTPRDSDDFIYKIADVSCSEGSLTLLSPNM